VETPFSLVEVCLRFGETYCFGFRSRKNKPKRIREEAGEKPVRLTHNHEDGGIIYLRNVGNLLPYYLTLHLRLQQFKVKVILRPTVSRVSYWREFQAEQIWATGGSSRRWRVH
jgi:hypothetical protein